MHYKKKVIFLHLFNCIYLSVGKKTNNFIFFSHLHINKSGNQIATLKRVEVYFKYITTLVKCRHYMNLNISISHTY